MAKREKPDQYAHRAKKEGYKARSVYKLSEMDEKVGLLGPGKRVLDVGAAPGSWSQYALKRVGSSGHVVAVDLKAIELPDAPNLTILEGDITAESLRAQLRSIGPFDAVLSDAAPSTTGNRTLDTARSAELVETMFGVVDELLLEGGTMAVKLFQGGEERELLAAARERFRTAKVQRPKASRSDSFEVYIVGTDYSPPANSGDRRHTR
ncbi:MAG: RlmE family RNA methyltransferase [Spirochaetota bacterium]